MAAAALLITVVLTNMSGEGTDPRAQRDPDAVAAGAALYAENCAVCHGADLRGTETGPPFLHPYYAPNHHGDEAFQRAVLGGVVPHHWDFGPMPPIPGLSRDQVALIVEFVRSEQEAAGILRDPSHP
jgi:mono/diheme cytochrome c family protein